MHITVEFYGVLRQVMGTQDMALELFDSTVHEALQHLCQQQPQLSIHLPRVACAVDDEIVSREHRMPDGATLALIPPVSGGST